nr:EamA family transporter [Paenibacillus psychroresistens]
MLKWRIGKFGSLPEDTMDKIIFLSRLMIDPFILFSFFSAFIASLFWIGAMTKFDISFAYPFMSLSFVLVFFISIFLFKEPVTFYKCAGMSLIVLGIIITSRT